MKLKIYFQYHPLNLQKQSFEMAKNGVDHFNESPRGRLMSAKIWSFVSTRESHVLMSVKIWGVDHFNESPQGSHIW